MHSRRYPIRLVGTMTLILGLPLTFWGCSQLQQASQAPTTQETTAEAEQMPVVEQAPPQDAAPFDRAAIAKIRDEGMNRSQVMQTMSYLTDVIGPRLTGSPNLKRANEWTRDQLTGWGLKNGALEAWGPFGRGWAVKRFTAEVIEPQSITLTAYPKAWSAGLDQPLEAEVVLFDPRSVDEMESYAGKLEGKIVLIGGERPVRAHFTADGVRYTDQELEQMARGRGNRAGAPQQAARGPAATQPGELLQATPGARGARGPATSNPAAAANNAARFFNFAAKEKAAIICTASTIGDGGTIFVQSAAVPSTAPADAGGRGARGPSAWSNEAPAITPQLTVAVEQYNRLVRMLKAGEKVKMAVNLQVQYYTEDNMAYNTVAEIPGTDLKEQIVMLGGHMDSWHSGTGATDNGAGVAVAMEAVRIIKALDLHPRRTVRIALWTGEEEGLFGSAAYVAKHFGTVQAGRGRGGGGGGQAQGGRGGRGARGGGPTSAPAPARVVRGPEYDNFSAYFNLDNGTGKIRGVYLQGNSAVGPTFKSWLEPFADLGATTITAGNTGSTDHVSFDNIGLPGFQFIQDQVEYNSRTHHSNADVFDRIQADDMKQASTILAAFVYNAAMMDKQIPRKPGFAPATQPQQITQAAAPANP